MNPRILRVGLSFFLGVAPVQAALRFGLGSAVANRAAQLTNSAGEATNPLPLPSCGTKTDFFTTLPVNDSSLIAINPIGHVFPPGHTFPADHGYFFFNAPLNSLLGVNLYAPSDGWVVQTTFLNFGSGGPQSGVSTEYFVAFSPCAEVTLNFLGIVSVVPAVANPTGPVITSCSNSNSAVPGVIETCITKMAVPFKAGELIGTGVSILGLDFGPMEDTRIPISGFVNPSRHDVHRGFCALDYFTGAAQATYTSMLGTNNGSVFIPRTTPPDCGTIMQDVAGTAQGDWYFPGQPNIPDNPHLALIHDNVYPSTATFSIGASVPGLEGAYSVYPKTTPDGSRLNYDFGLVQDTQIYCYDSFMDLLVNGQGVPDAGLAGHIVLIQLSPSLNTLKIELQNPGTACAAAAPWSFTGNAVNFQR